LSVGPDQIDQSDRLEKPKKPKKPKKPDKPVIRRWRPSKVVCRGTIMFDNTVNKLYTIA
jgi:hypothetical protein